LLNWRLTVAEFAVGRVFIHAGVIAWKGQAVVMPDRSFYGKTALGDVSKSAGLILKFIDDNL
jgi:hypothetical protein